jgi:hypothetical protein
MSLIKAVVKNTLSHRKFASTGNLESVLLLKLRVSYFTEQVEIFEIPGRLRVRKKPSCSVTRWNEHPVDRRSVAISTYIYKTAIVNIKFISVKNLRVLLATLFSGERE